MIEDKSALVDVTGIKVNLFKNWSKKKKIWNWFLFKIWNTERNQSTAKSL